MDAVAALGYALSLVVSVGSVGAGVGMFASRLELREDWRLRAAALAALVAAEALVFWACILPGLDAADPSEAFSYVEQLGLFSALLAMAAAVVIWMWEASPWTALFCCTAGYALQNFASGATELVWMAAGVTDSQMGGAEGHLVRFALNLIAIAVVYAPFYLAFVRHLSKEGLEQIQNRSLVLIMAVVMLGIIGFDLLIKCLGDGGLGLSYVVILRGMHGIMCALTYALEYELLVSRHLAMEAAATERVLAERERQYEQSRANIEAINVKCHDLRHQIRHLGEAGGAGVAAVDPAALADIAREVDVYDSTVRTGNDALDTILTEKRLLCTREGVSLSVVADGSALAMMSAADIYSFFGNALDNAIEAAEKIEDPAARSISVVVRQAAGVASIHVENRFAASNAPQVRADGLLATSKADTTAHGFGVRSMRLTVERYGGTLATLVQGDTFHVNAILPLQ